MVVQPWSPKHQTEQEKEIDRELWIDLGDMDARYLGIARGRKTVSSRNIAKCLQTITERQRKYNVFSKKSTLVVKK